MMQGGDSRQQHNRVASLLRIWHCRCHGTVFREASSWCRTSTCITMCKWRLLAVAFYEGCWAPEHSMGLRGYLVLQNVTAPGPTILYFCPRISSPPSSHTGGGL